MGICIGKIKISRPLPNPEEMILTPNNSSNNSDQFRFADGRRYHNVESATYFLPNDSEECDRLHLQHSMERFIWQSNFSSPVENLLNQDGTMVLDSGTGAGSWVLEMAAKYTKSKFIGMDISQVQPEENKPPNVEFIQGNLLERLPFDDNTFDFIFQRFLFVGIPADKWPSVINELVRILKPGGYLELVENDLHYETMGPASRKLIEAFTILFHEHGLNPSACYKIQNYLEENDQLHNVHYEQKKHLDEQSIAKVCKLLAEDYSSALANVKPKLMNKVNVSSDEYDRLVKEMEKETIELESFNPHFRAYAQKNFVKLKLQV
ncbi:S-adenosyl-L-methionine-dependent methyltransferase [Gigaspora margarita]|uniref:S-adenosyl-L-methionine-dependent methyltransferase n=1 Tax=Gigaspora margarita TaxID=4874 RepID=A0A8H4AXS6_GIGMA|nr:S-adenosyl-L-methionine-dependent methyltransferase [Gigaspora margarita]